MKWKRKDYFTIFVKLFLMVKSYDQEKRIKIYFFNVFDLGVLHFGPARDKVKASYKPRKFKMAYSL